MIRPLTVTKQNEMANKKHLISIKALFIGFLIFVIIKLSMLALSFIYLPWVFENMGEMPLGNLNETIALIVFYQVFYLFIAAALPGYITAFVANKNYILHGAIIAVVARCISILSIDGQINISYSKLIWIVLNISVTIIAAWGRGFQVRRRKAPISS